MRFSKVCFWLFATAVLLALPVQAAKLPCEPADTACRTLLDADPDSADGGGAQLANRGRVNFVLGDDKKTGSATFTRNSLGHKFSVKLTAPIDEDSGSAEFVGFEGLNDASSLELEYNYISWSRIDFDKIRAAGVTAAALLEGRLVYCAAHLEALADVASQAPLEAGWPQVRPILEELQGLQLTAPAGFREPPQTSTIRQYFAAGPGANTDPRDPRYELIRVLEDRSGAQESPCTQQAWKQIRGFFKAAQQEPIKQRGVALEQLLAQPENSELGVALAQLGQGGLARAQFLTKRWNPFIGVVGTIGYKKFEFLDRDLLTSSGEVKKTDDREAPWSFGIQGGWVVASEEKDKGDESLIISVSSERGFKAAGAVQSCKPVEGFEGVSSIRSCEDVPLGGPQEIDSVKAGVEWRKKEKSYAWAARIFYRDRDDKDTDYGFEMPIYFVRDKEKSDKESKLTGGVRFSWSELDGEAVAVFVGVPFKVEPN